VPNPAVLPAAKKLRWSKTFWVNTFVILIEVADYLAGTGYLPPEWVAIGLPILNIVLRRITKSPITPAALTAKIAAKVLGLAIDVPPAPPGPSTRLSP
jgi:hypothetical protein